MPTGDRNHTGQQSNRSGAQQHAEEGAMSVSRMPIRATHSINRYQRVAPRVCVRTYLCYVWSVSTHAFNRHSHAIYFRQKNLLPLLQARAYQCIGVHASLSKSSAERSSSELKLYGKLPVCPPITIDAEPRPNLPILSVFPPITITTPLWTLLSQFLLITIDDEH